MGVATGCGCKEVYRFPHTTYPYSVLFYSSIPTFCSLKKYFLVYRPVVYTAMDMNNKVTIYGIQVLA